MTRIEREDGTVAVTQESIAKEQAQFYQDLYTSQRPDIDRHDQVFFPNEKKIKELTEEEQQSCERPITKEECHEALKDMQNNKTPGTDGLSAEFYKHFWNQISTIMLNSFNHSFTTGNLTAEQRRGMITLIPKKTQDVSKLKNWRPITLLNIDYKIITKVIASRMKTVLQRIISNDQTGFLKNRFIGENIRLILDINEHLKNTDRGAFIMLIDFKKAFDTIEHSFIQKH